MTLFLWVTIVLTALEVLGRAVWLYERNEQRNLAALPWSIAVNVAFIIWAAYLLGGQP